MSIKKKEMTDKFYINLEDLLNNYISNYITGQWENAILVEQKTLENIIALTKVALPQLNSSEDEIRNRIYLKLFKEIYNQIEDKGKDETSLDMEFDFSELHGQIETLFQKFPKKIKQEQLSERFLILPKDILLIRILKTLKKGLYWLSVIPKKIYNVARRIFKKDPIEIRLWHQVIPLQLLTHYHLEYLFPLELRKYKSSLNAELAIILSNFWKYWNSKLAGISDQKKDKVSNPDNQPNYSHEQFMNYMKDIERLRQKIQPDLDEIVKERITKMKDDVSIVGTIEYQNWRLKKKYLIKSRSRIKKAWSLNCKGWINTFYAIYDDCRSDIKIFIVQNKMLGDVYHLGKLQSSDEYRFASEFLQINKVFEETLLKLKNHDGNPRKALVESKYSILKQLDKGIIPHLSEKINSKNLSGLISSLENNVDVYLMELKGNFVIVKSENYTKPLENSELEHISIYDLIAYELLPGLNEALANIKNTLFIKLGTLHGSIEGLHKIAVFAIESAITNIENPETNEQESLKIGLDGIQRANNKLQQIKNSLDALYQENYEEIKKIITEFNNSLLEYTVNENALEIKIRIVKSKAIEQSKAIRKKTFDNIKKSVKSSFVFLIEINKYFNKWFAYAKNRFLLTAPMPVLSREVSDFLSYSNKKIEGLPILYKNLYKIQPVQDADLFIGRENELKKLKDSYDNWLLGNYSTTALIGEKWGGLTSLISHYIKINQFPHKTYRITITERIYDEIQFIELLNKEIGNQGIKDIETLIEVLNSLPSKRIIIIEDIQKMFLRTVNGFDGIKVLFKILAWTNKNIFWLVSCTIYAWNFLKQSLSIDDYFSNVVIIEKVQEDQVIEIIKKRNDISGLNVVIEPNGNKLALKKLKGLNEADKQAFLFKSYFKELADFSESNISLALLFWLLSTKEITDNKLIIGHFNTPDLSFVKVMNIDRILVLMALILHDGLNEIELSRVNNITREEAKLKLIMLLEDGIVYLQNKRYLVNPLIYRNVIKLLKSKNLIQQ